MVRLCENYVCKRPHNVCGVVGRLRQDPVPDFDYEAAEHVLEAPPSLQLVCGSLASCYEPLLTFVAIRPYSTQ